MTRTLRPNAWGALQQTLRAMQSEVNPDPVPPSPCPHCGKVLDSASAHDGAKPDPGDISVCVYCAGLNQFSVALTLEPLPTARFEALASEDQESIREHQNTVRSIHLRRRGKRGEA